MTGPYRKIIVFLFFLFVFNVGKGESTGNTNYAPRDYSIVPPSPSVSNLIEIQEYPMDNNRGVPDISFPLYTLKSGAISVPIVLTYQGGGIRTKQKTGNAGHGWTVLCGATIGHTIYGAPDDANDNIHGLWHLNSSETSFRNKLIEKKADYDPTDWTHFDEKLTWEVTEGDRYVRGLTDVANDQYSLYGLGLSAIFAYDKNRTLILQSEKPLSVKYGKVLESVKDGGCDGLGYVVKDQNGLTYYFNTQERTKYVYKYGPPALEQMTDSVYYASAWHIDKISDLAGNNIEFKYDSSPSKRFNDFGNSRAEYVACNESQIVDRRHVRSCSSVEYFPKILRSIYANGIRIRFEYLHEEFGNINEPLLKNIVIESPEETRTIHFKYNSISRMVLTSVTDNGEEIYAFDYEKDENGLLDFYDDSQDFGGYNNGIDNGTLIPTVANFGEDANRSVVPDAAKLGALKRISYPTGGYTEFVWESNTFSKIGGGTYSGGSLNDPVVYKTQADTLRMCMDTKFKKLKLDNYIVAEMQSVNLDLTPLVSLKIC